MILVNILIFGLKVISLSNLLPYKFYDQECMSTGEYKHVIYAEGAEIEVYDTMGRLIIAGSNAVAIENTNYNIFVVKTKYVNGQVYVTKIANR